MKTTIKVDKEIDIQLIRIQVPVSYGEEDIPNEFQFRKGDVWDAFVYVDTGIIRDWKPDKLTHLEMKVCDGGTYTLFDQHGDCVAKLENEYVPHGVVPGEYGDYIRLHIDSTGKIINWPKQLEFGRFFVGNSNED